MGSLDKLRLQLPGVKDDLLTLLLEDAAASVRAMTNRTDVTPWETAVRAVAVLMYNRTGQEGQSAYSAGGVSMSYQELPDAVKHLLPPPLANVGGRRFEHVEAEPEAPIPGDPAQVGA